MWETLRKEEVLQKLRTKQGVGLTQREVQVRKQKYGNNKLQEKKKEPSWNSLRTTHTTLSIMTVCIFCLRQECVSLSLQD